MHDLTNCTVKDLISVLMNYPMDMSVSIMGEPFPAIVREESGLHIDSQKYFEENETFELPLHATYIHEDRPNWERCSELMTNAIHALFDADEETAIEWCEEQDMSESELRYTGIDARIEEYEEDDGNG